MATKKPTTKRTTKKSTPAEQGHGALMQGLRDSLGIKAPKGNR
jgi:hypothetical protein